MPTDYPAWLRECPYCNNYRNRFPPEQARLDDLAKRWDCTLWEVERHFYEHFHSEAGHQVNGYDGIKDETAEDRHINRARAAIDQYNAGRPKAKYKAKRRGASPA
jgi:hypothetical protein